MDRRWTGDGAEIVRRWCGDGSEVARRWRGGVRRSVPTGMGLYFCRGFRGDGNWSIEAIGTYVYGRSTVRSWKLHVAESCNAHGRSMAFVGHCLGSIPSTHRVAARIMVLRQFGSEKWVLWVCWLICVRVLERFATANHMCGYSS
eukprot:90344-Pleurochrysis_carterae.AAC.2